jgi:hypothetical protein
MLRIAPQDEDFHLDGGGAGIIRKPYHDARASSAAAFRR